MAKYEDIQFQLLHDYQISKSAKFYDLPNLIHLEKIAKGEDNLCLIFKKYSMDFRDYLRHHRDPLVLPLILQ
jgi:hypothetical protein